MVQLGAVAGICRDEVEGGRRLQPGYGKGTLKNITQRRAQDSESGRVRGTAGGEKEAARPRTV